MLKEMSKTLRMYKVTLTSRLLQIVIPPLSRSLSYVLMLTKLVAFVLHFFYI